MKAFLLIVTAFVLTGCSAKYSTNNIQNSNEPLHSEAPVAISKPTDGAYEGHAYPGSGSATASAIRAAFLKHSDDVMIVEECNDLNCLKNKHAIGNGYYVVPQILHWEDRATQWSGIPDQIEVKITIYDAASNNRVASTVISGKSKWATLGGDHPQDLLRDPVNDYISNLY